MRVLVTGFEPFGGDDANASADAVRALAAADAIPGVELVTAILPVSFARAPAALAAAVESTRPDAVLSVGEAGGRTAVTPERFAANERVARIPDNDGARPAGPIDDGPELLAGGLDVDAAVAACRAAGVAAEPSDDAGRFVCNAVFRAALTCFDGPAGFVHVPALRASGASARVGAETDENPAAPGPTDALTVLDLARALGAVISTLPAPPRGGGDSARMGAWARFG
ncbi:MAG: hypothetical protein QM713_13210 [Arachnia sp.]